MKFIDSFRFMSSSLSSLVDNSSEGVHNGKCRKCKSCLEYISIEDNKLRRKCTDCNKIYKLHFNKDLMNRFANTYDFCNKDINNLLILLLRNGIDPHEYMDSWKRSDKTLLPNKEDFYSCLNMEDITDVDYRHAKKYIYVLYKEFKINNVGDYHDLYVQSDTLLLADVLENFRIKCIGIYELDSAHFLSGPGLAVQAFLKKTEIKLELLTDFDMLLMVEKGIRGGICHAIHRYAKANNKYMKK